MAAAYAALVSVLQIIDQIQHHPRPPISLHQQQLQSLTQTASFLQQFLEAGYTTPASYTGEADPLEMRIADAAHAVEDVIESHIVDQILGDRGEVSSVDLYDAVQSVIDEMEVVKKEAMDVQDKMPSHPCQMPGAASSTSAGLSTYDWPEQYATMVGFDGILNQVLDKLTSDASSRHIISITGMGGMGKTTLAKNVFKHQLVVEHFDLRGWVTVSQEYNIRKINLKLLEGDEKSLSQVDDYALGHMLYQKLIGRRYLIIMDDIWNIEVWDRLRLFFPENNNGSRIMITTRLSKLAREIDESHNMEMELLGEENSWELFCKHVFGDGECPLELKGIGKKIVEGCKGLPLSISVVGGLFAKSKPNKQYWEEIAENLNSTVNLEDDKHCLHLLYLSYNNLPLHLRPVFLLMGVIEDADHVLFIVGFLIAAGVVKPISGKSLEETAIEYVVELVDRNLIFIDKPNKTRNWNFVYCRVHDLLRDLCVRESEKQKFAYVVGERGLSNIPQRIDSIRCVCVTENAPTADVLSLFESASLLRLLRCHHSQSMDSLPSSRLLRVGAAEGMTITENIVHKVNLRIIVVDNVHQFINLSSMSRFWNLQMLVELPGSSEVATVLNEIWMMPQLRFMRTQLCTLPDPPSCETGCSIVLENLHSLYTVYNLKCSEEVVKRIPHIKNLGICYGDVQGSEVVDYSLNNIGRLQQLQLLDIEVQMPNQNLSINFPLSLVMLSLAGTSLHWDEVTTKIGSLPLLQYLDLDKDSCIGAKWETMECQFRSLKYLRIKECRDLECWITESTHFRLLEELILTGLDKLEEIPSSVGDIPTLQSIELHNCCDSVNSSAQRIEEEQEELGNEDLQVKIY